MRISILMFALGSCVFTGSLVLLQPAQSANPNVIDVFGRTGHIRAVAGDYNTSLVPEGAASGNQYFTAARARVAFSATAPLAYNPVTGVFSCSNCGGGGTTTLGVASWSGRTGDVLPQSGDYRTDMVPEGLVNQYFTQTRARGAISVAPPLVYNPATGIISCPSCVVLDAAGNISIPGSLTTGSSSTAPGSISLPGIADGFICASGGKLVSQVVPCK